MAKFLQKSDWAGSKAASEKVIQVFNYALFFRPPEKQFRQITTARAYGAEDAEKSPNRIVMRLNASPGFTKLSQ